ncbi:MAG: cupin domain-containing protein [Desulfovibrio sp.]|nr:cupin domain-containing protein [Desulfovibrio sp.]
MPSAHTIGSRIHAMRLEHDMDIQTLAQNTGLSVSYLEKLENDAIYPCIGPLQKVSRALGVRLGTFLDDQFTRDPVISSIHERAEADEALHTGRIPHAGYAYHALAKGKNDRNMEPFYIRIYPVSGERKTTSHQGEEFICVLKGELLVVYGRETHVLTSGQTIYYNSVVPHYIGAAGDDPVEIIAVTYNP